MCAPAVFAIAGAAVQAKGQYDQGQYQAAVNRNNATLAGYQAADVTQRAGYEAGDIQTQGRQVANAARAGIEGGNIDSTSGSAANLITSSNIAAAQDAARVKANAARAAWGFTNEIQDYQTQARLVKRASYMNAFGTGLAGIGGAASYAAKSRADSQGGSSGESYKV